EQRWTDYGIGRWRVEIIFDVLPFLGSNGLYRRTVFSPPAQRRPSLTVSRSRQNVTQSPPPPIQPRSLGRQPQSCEFRPHNSFPLKTTFLDGFPVIHFGERATRNFEGPLFFRPERWDQVREHEVFRTCAFG